MLFHEDKKKKNADAGTTYIAAVNIRCFCMNNFSGGCETSAGSI